MKITEKDGRFRSTIIIPEEAVDDMAKLLSKISENFSPAERTADRREEFEAQRKEFENRRAAREDANNYDSTADNPVESDKF